MSLIKKNSDHVYYNISISHDSRVEPNGAPTKMVFSETRDDNILDNPSEYDGSVVRFTIPSNLIPLTRIYIQPPPNTDINLTVYSVTLQYMPTGQYYKTYLIYTPENNTAPIPNSVYNIGDPNYVEYGQYYFCYSEQQFLNMINTAFIQSLSKLNSDHPGYKQFSPYMYKVNDKFAMNIPSSYIIPNSNIKPQFSDIKIFMNRSLAIYFSNSFHTKTIGYNRPNGDDVEFLVDNLPNLVSVQNSYCILGDVNYQLNPVYLPGSGGNGYPGYASTNVIVAIQDFNTLPLWYEPVSIVLVSVGIPVKNELLPNAGISLNNQNSLVGSNIINQITDFDTHTTTGSEYRTYTQYFPTAEYRYFNLTSTSPLKSFTIQAFWKDNYNNYYPIYLPSFLTANIKILFKKKI